MIAPTTRRTRIGAFALICAASLLASACGSGASSPSEPSEGASVSASNPPGTNTSASPLDDLLGFPSGDDDAMDEYFANLTRQAEAKIAGCMVAKGFEYRPVDYAQFDDATNQVDFDSREYAEQYGFGIASNPFEESFEAFDPSQDPNQAYVKTLSEGESEAYQTALNGELPDFDASSESDFFEPGGCQGAAYEELFSFGKVFEQFGNEFEAIEQAYNSDRRIVQATSGWSSCMSAAGYRFTDQRSTEAEMKRRYDAIVRDPDAFNDDDFNPEDAEEVTISGAGNEEVFVFGPQTLKPEFQARVDELAVEERAIATASWDCNAPLREIADDVRVEYEQRFVDENGAAITAALDE